MPCRTCARRPASACCGCPRWDRLKSALPRRCLASRRTGSSSSSSRSAARFDREHDEASGAFSYAPERVKETTLKYLYSTLAAVALSSALSLTSTAAHAAELKIGFIDAERINRESAPAELASKRLEKEFAPRMQE